ncbi:male-enhanced antigen 1 isoform X2 [Xenopus tropicalis]|uniref:Male-enhanced antigen 1 n=1 Tax=Xenopus tropicalis TaxID=8364 RepID=A0A8J1JHL3_XENTR|nr:male-enhanced antigen 1 isoform X2 [Xenopus tropicalis]
MQSLPDDVTGEEAVNCASESPCSPVGNWSGQLPDKMGPERVFPNQSDELGDAQDATVEWSGGEEEEEDGEVQSGYQYQPLNQDPEEGTQTEGDIQERLQAMRLHLPEPPADSEDEEEREEAASSIPMDPAHVELVKKAMAGVTLPSLSVPLWAEQISDADWEHLVHQTIQSRAAAPPSGKK